MQVKTRVQYQDGRVEGMVVDAQGDYRIEPAPVEGGYALAFVDAATGEVLDSCAASDAATLEEYAEFISAETRLATTDGADFRSTFLSNMGLD